MKPNLPTRMIGLSKAGELRVIAAAVVAAAFVLVWISAGVA